MNIDQWNEDNASDDAVFKPNLKGFAVGNGATNWEYDTVTAYIEMGYWHSLYDTALYDLINLNNCDYGGLNPDLSDQCLQYYMDFANLTEDVNVYNIFGTCYGLGKTPILYSTNE